MHHNTSQPDVPLATIDHMRALNRLVTQTFGIVDRTVLGSDMTLTEMRLLYELGEPNRTARGLARTLKLDEGYVSRILKRFLTLGWLTKTPSSEDARISLLNLTEEGARIRAHYEDVARRDVAQVLARTSFAERPAVDRAIARLRGALGDANWTEADLVLRDMEAGDLGWLVQRHAELYTLENGFDGSMETLVAEILLDFVKTRDPARERAFIPERDGLGLGSVFCVQGPEPDQAQLRLFWLEPSVRGTGLGRRMIDAWLTFARAAGYRRATLWTHESHAEAGRLYARSGFAITGTKPTRNFGQAVVEQQWERTL